MGDSCYTYIIECSDGTLYTGWTNNLERRIKVHNSEKGAKYTRGRLPVKYAAVWCFETKSEAMRWEYFLKRLPRANKLQLIQESQENLPRMTESQSPP